MKIGGVEVTAHEELLVLPRPEGTPDIPFRAKAVSINDEFNKKVPLPTPPNILKKGKNVPDIEDEDYQKQIAHRNEQRLAFLILKSLEPSDIEWETVDLEKPGTWLNWADELTDNGISDVEINRIVDAVMSACSLNEARIEEARRAFLLGQEA